MSLSPIGSIDSVTVQGDQALITGWTFDFSDTAQAIGVVVDNNGKHVAWGPTAVARDDVNGAWSITGKHGFSYSVKLAAGTNRLCVYAVNIGTGGGNSLLGCRSVSRAAGAARTECRPARHRPVRRRPAQPGQLSAGQLSAGQLSTGQRPAPASSAPASSTSRRRARLRHVRCRRPVSSTGTR